MCSHVSPEIGIQVSDERRTAPERSGARGNLELLATPKGGQFREKVLASAPSDVIKITCIDWRGGDRGAYLLTSAGAVVHSAMVEDLGLVLAGKKALLLQGHSDCAKSKAECPRFSGETDSHYAKRVDEWSLVRLWRNAGRLLDVPEVQRAILEDGLKFCVAFHDVARNKVKFFERETAELLGSRFALKAA